MYEEYLFFALSLLLASMSCAGEGFVPYCDPSKDGAGQFLIESPKTFSSGLTIGLCPSDNMYISNSMSYQSLLRRVNFTAPSSTFAELLGSYKDVLDDFFTDKVLIITTIHHSSSARQYELLDILFDFASNSYESRFSYYAPIITDHDYRAEIFITEVVRLCGIKGETVVGSYTSVNMRVF